MKKALLVLFFSLGFSISASAQTVKMRSADALSTNYQKASQKFTGTLKPGYHFNDKAPNNVVVDGKEISPLKLQSQKIDFKIPKTFSQARASLYVCDDAVTYCETHSIDLKGETSQKSSVPVGKQSATNKKKSKVNAFGFIEDDYQKALSEAAAKKKLILADFSARWCPGCVRYEKEVFSTAQFAKISKDVVKVKIDIDKFDNFALAEKFKIKTIPALIVMNADEQEISRVIDFQPVETLESLLKTTAQDPTPMKALLAEPRLDSQKSLLLGQRLLVSGQAAASIPYLEKVSPAPPELLKARIDTAKAAHSEIANDETKKKLVQELRSALQKESQSSRSIAWRTQLVGLLEPKSKDIQTLAAEGVTVADNALKNSEFLAAAVKTDDLGEFVGYEKLWVSILKAELIEAAGTSSESIAAAWNEAAEIGASYKVSPERSGPALRYLIVLTAAKKFPEAEKLANAILKHDPNNTDVKRRKLKVLMGLGKSEEAVKLGEKILPEAEGRNEFWVAESLAKAYLATNKKLEAKRLLTAYLARPEIQTEKMKPSKKAFEELLQTSL